MKKVLNILIIMIMVITFITGCVTQKKYSILSIPDNASIYYSKSNKFLEKEVVMIGSTPFPMSQVREGWYQIRKEGFSNSKTVRINKEQMSNEMFYLQIDEATLKSTSEANTKSQEKLDIPKIVIKPSSKDNSELVKVDNELKLEKKNQAKLEKAIRLLEKRLGDAKDENNTQKTKELTINILKLTEDLKASKDNQRQLSNNIDKLNSMLKRIEEVQKALETIQEKKDVKDESSYRVAGKTWGELYLERDKALREKDEGEKELFDYYLVEFLLTKKTPKAKVFLTQNKKTVEVDSIAN